MKLMSRIIITVIFISFNLLLVQDYFPESTLNLYLPKRYLIFIISLGILVSFFIPDLRKNRTVTLKSILVNLGLLIYLVITLIVLQLLGGESEKNISLSNPILLILLVLGMINIVSSFRKYQESNKNI